MSKRRSRGRKDHYLPQGYLRGFIDPAREREEKPLWYLDFESRTWSEKSPAEVGWEKGFYDYATNSDQLEDPDAVFAKFEREYPLVRNRMLERGFKGWAKQQKPFLLSYMQMMRARSPLFIEEQTIEKESLRGATITAIEGNKITVDSLVLRPLPAAEVRNGVISGMHQEIRKGADWMSDFHWCLRYTTSPALSFPTGRQPLIQQGQALSRVAAMKHPGTLIFFPLCWQACLVGSPARFDVGTQAADSALIQGVREIYSRSPGGYLIAAQPFDVPEPEL